jgi:hypothetical protein
MARKYRTGGWLEYAVQQVTEVPARSLKHELLGIQLYYHGG